MKRCFRVILFLFNVIIVHTHQAPQYAFHLFGYPLASRIGVAASPFTATSEGIRMASECGFDIITYKTIRSAETPIKSPYIYYVDVHHQLTRNDIGRQLTVIDHEPTEQDRAITNCYGMGSSCPEETIEEIMQARAYVAQGQVLIVSMYGSGNDVQEQIADFVHAARIAHAGGAHIIEVNLSCPNLANTALMYKQPTLVYAICSAIKAAIPDIPLSIKVGVFDTREQMQDVIVAAYQAGVRGICGINTIPVRVVDGDGKPIYGPDRQTSGLSGYPIRALALEFTRDARAIIDMHHLDMVLFATGGVMNAQDFDDFLRAGADIVLCATGAMINPNVALEYKAAH